MMPEVVLYSKPGCCLCDEVKARLARLQKRHPFAWREVNILDDPALLNRFKADIPLILVDGRVAFGYPLEESKFVERIRLRPPNAS